MIKVSAVQPISAHLQACFESFLQFRAILWRLNDAMRTTEVVSSSLTHRCCTQRSLPTKCRPCPIWRRLQHSLASLAGRFHLIRYRKKCWLPKHWVDWSYPPARNKQNTTSTSSHHIITSPQDLDFLGRPQWFGIDQSPFHVDRAPRLQQISPNHLEGNFAFLDHGHLHHPAETRKMRISSLKMFKDL